LFKDEIRSYSGEGLDRKQIEGIEVFALRISLLSEMVALRGFKQTLIIRRSA